MGVLNLAMTAAKQYLKKWLWGEVCLASCVCPCSKALDECDL